MKRVLMMAGAALAFGAAFPAQAQPQQDRMIVRLTGLQLDGDGGAQIALKRIENAAATFCPAPAQRFFDRDNAQCRAEMTVRAVDQLNAPLVTALYQTRSASRILLASR